MDLNILRLFSHFEKEKNGYIQFNGKIIDMILPTNHDIAILSEKQNTICLNWQCSSTIKEILTAVSKG